MASRQKFHFMPANYDGRRSKRDDLQKESLTAKRHAARIAHQRRVEHELERRRHDKDRALQSFDHFTRVPNARGGLDPFLVVGLDLSPEGGSYLQHCRSFPLAACSLTCLHAHTQAC
jgi:hypothetical protein